MIALPVARDERLEQLVGHETLHRLVRHLLHFLVLELVAGIEGQELKDHVVTGLVRAVHHDLPRPQLLEQHLVVGTVLVLKALLDRPAPDPGERVGEQDRFGLLAVLQA